MLSRDPSSPAVWGHWPRLILTIADTGTGRCAPSACRNAIDVRITAPCGQESCRPTSAGFVGHDRIGSEFELARLKHLPASTADQLPRGRRGTTPIGVNV